MAKVHGLNLDVNEVSQTLDLEKLTGVDTSIDQDLQNEIAQATIDYIKARVIDENKGIGGVKLKAPYTKTYQDSLDFQAAGKSASDINMTLSGDMLGAMDVMADAGPLVLIGIDDDAQSAKAYGHQTGFKGHPNEAKLKKYKREFFGITDAEFKNNVLPQFQDRIDNIKEREPSERQSLINVIRNAGDLFGEES